MAPGRMILINGASSAGKSTLARAVQRRALVPLVRLTFDQLIDTGGLPPRDGAAKFDWQAIRLRVFDGYHRALGAWLAAGNDLVVDHIIETPAMADDLRRILAGADLFLVALHCPLDELLRREAARGDRGAGGAEKDFHTVHQGLVYDLELQTVDGAEANADRLLAAWERRGPVSAFFGGR